jgi:hypothetical protein
MRLSGECVVVCDDCWFVKLLFAPLVGALKFFRLVVRMEQTHGSHSKYRECQYLINIAPKPNNTTTTTKQSLERALLPRPAAYEAAAPLG